MGQIILQDTLGKQLERLNDKQLEAVRNIDGPELIIAGAGSGKTSVLTTRIAYLLSNDASPERILALTFTKKAAGEMRSRIEDMTGPAARMITMGTFHSVFIRFIRPFSQRIGFPENFTIMDEEDSDNTLKRCVEKVVKAGRPPKEEWTKEMESRFKSEDEAYKTRTIKSVISSCKNNLVTADMYAADKARQASDALLGRPLTWRIFLEYRDTCHRSGVMDFDDILLHTDILLANNPDILKLIAGSYDHILVDEYQDTNSAQYSILRRLTYANKNICVVGDDSQSIYAFRGARIQNILNFHKDYPGCAVIKLERNYRSTGNIVAAANNLISRNEGRIPKTCFTDKDGGQKIGYKALPNEKTEATYIASAIKRRIQNGETPGYGDVAVLYRTNSQSRAIEDALVKERIPYAVRSGTAFFERMEIKDQMAYYKLAVNPRDDESFARVVNKPVRGFGQAALGRLRDVASAWGMSLWDAASNPSIGMCGFAPKALKGLMSFVEDIRYCARAAATSDAREAADAIDKLAGFHEAYSADPNDNESMTRADNLRELSDSISAYVEETLADNEPREEKDKEYPTLAGYLQNAALLTNADTAEDGTEKVSLMTVHCAKGLEFDTVFVAGMEKGLFPLEMEGKSDEEEEERRLFYVAVTRAKNKLILTRTESRMRFGKRKKAEESMFIGELTRKKS